MKAQPRNAEAVPPKGATNSPSPIAGRLRARHKVAAALRIWVICVSIAWKVRRWPLPQVVSWLERRNGRAPLRLSPARLSRMVDRVLRVGAWRPRCLTRSLVLYHLLRQQRLPAEIVIGLPERARTKEAHAWVELQGIDVGPPPGRSGHVELARYGPGMVTDQSNMLRQGGAAPSEGDA